MNRQLVVGMDFGTDSARGIVVDVHSGEVLTAAVSPYIRWSKGFYCDPSCEIYRQHPLDYIEAIDNIFSSLHRELPQGTFNDIIAIGTNTTGSTPVAVDRTGSPLSLLKGFENNPNAMFVLWKDHSATNEAIEINNLSKSWPIDYTAYSGGIYSSEWFWSKVLHICRIDSDVLTNTYTWVEQSDWIPNYLIGNSDAKVIQRNRCAAGHKAMWNEDHGGLPSKSFLSTLDPLLDNFANQFYIDTFTSDQKCGNISKDFVEKYGFSPSTVICVGGIDAHHGAIGAGSKPYTLIKVLGTSTCDMLVVPSVDNPPLVAGICGQVDGSIDPGMIGFEAGQSAFGDVYNWYKKFILKPVYSILGNRISDNQKEILESEFFDFITAEAEKIKVDLNNIVFTDYFNGRRTPDADFTKVAAGFGLNLSTDAGQVFRGLVEATAFGSRCIIERFDAYQIPINSIIATGGIATKSSFVVQVLSDVLGKEIDVVDSDQICALGSAIFASVAGGIYSDVHLAKQRLAARIIKTYKPNYSNHNIYNQLFEKYKILTKI